MIDIDNLDDLDLEYALIKSGILALEHRKAFYNTVDPKSEHYETNKKRISDVLEYGYRRFDELLKKTERK